MTGHIFTEGIIGNDYPEKIKAQIAELPADCTEVYHHIKSPGGNVYAAWKAMPELMKIGKPVTSLIEGEASSIASWIAIAPASRVEATDPSTMMVHEPFFPEGLNGALGIDDLDEARVELSQIRQSMAEAYAKKSGKPVDEWMAVMKKKTRFNAQMALQMGLVDKVNSIEPRRIAAEVMDEIKNELVNFKNDMMGLFKKTAPAAVAAMELATKDGKKVNVETEDDNLIGKKATVDGVAAVGEVSLADGRVLVCDQGMVKEVKTAMPEETAEQKMARELSALKDKIAAIEAAEQAKIKAEQEAKVAAEEKAKAEQATKDAEAKAKEVESKAAALAEENEKLKKQTVGNMEKPFMGTNPSPQPAAFAKTSDEKINLMVTRTFLADNMPWLERFYKGGKYSDGTAFNSYSSIGGPNAVSILETNLNYTWNGILSTDLFFKPTLSSPALADIFTVDLGAKNNKRYHIAPTASKILKPYTGCDQAVTGTSLNITSKNLQLKPFQMYESWCKDDFTDQLTGSFNVLAQEWLKSGNESFDPAGTPIDRMIVQLLKDGLRRDVFRRVSFGDTTSSNADYNQIDGLWQSLIDQSGASNYCVYRYGSALGVGTLSAGTAQTYLEGIFNNSSNLLKEQAIDGGKGQFLVTRSVWENLYNTYATTGAVTEQAFGNQVKGLPRLTFRGIPVTPITIWDDFLADSNNPLSATTRHLIAFTIKDNHILGVENTADLDKIDSWFEKKDNKRYYRSNMTMGFLGAIHCDLTTISY